MDSLTRPPSMTPEEAEKVEQLIGRGARIEIRDPRVSQVQTWFLGIVGTSIVGGLGLIASNMVDMNKNIAMLVQRLDFKDQTDKQQDRHMEAIDAKDDRQEERINYLERFHPADISDRRLHR